jgi:spermidine/putrescine transport system substrate-binding protein
MTDVLSRRQLLRRAAAGGAFLTVPGVLAACGGTSKKAASTTANKTLAKTLRFSNWTLYIDVNEKTKRHPTLDAFKKKTGTTVQYTEDVNDNASYFGKIQGPLSRGQSIDRDIIVMTDNSRYPSLLIKTGWV